MLDIQLDVHQRLQYIFMINIPVILKSSCTPLVLVGFLTKILPSRLVKADLYVPIASILRLSVI